MVTASIRTQHKLGLHARRDLVAPIQLIVSAAVQANKLSKAARSLTAIRTSQDDYHL